MESPNRKLTPAEFLLELQKESARSTHFESTRTQNSNELELDFSDLNAPAPASATATATAAAAEAPGPRRPAGEVAARAEPPSPAGNRPPTAANPTPRTPREAAGTDAEPRTARGEAAGEAVPSATASKAVKSNAQISALFDRVHSLLGSSAPAEGGPWYPRAPETLEQTGLMADEIERLVLKFLLAKGCVSGRRIATQICLPFAIVDPLLKGLKQDQLVAYKGSATMGDYEFILTEQGRERARRYSSECTYFGAATVHLRDYLKAMEMQSIAKQHATEADLRRAFSDLIINQRMLDKLGPAINSGRGMFLFGEPGNGKTSIAERITGCFGSTIWVPRALGIDGDIIRIFDPAVHTEIRTNSQDNGILNTSGIDQRWVQIRRPTVIAGGELTMSELEVKQNTTTKICEAPLQLKSNCGTLVIDDFGRQRMPVADLLNRWIVPLEKRYDFLNLPSGKKIQVPFDQLIIFSTNLEPKDLVDGAFLRRIPYKIEVCDPTAEEFHKLFEVFAPMQGFRYDRATIDYLIQTHYTAKNRPFRACQPRDLLLQVRNYCLYKGLPKVMTPEAFDFACENYFSVM